MFCMEVLLHDGRFYLVKDSRIKKESFEKSDVRISEYREFRQHNLLKHYRSCQSDRLSL